MGLSKMMQQYLEIKEQHKDAIVFFRLGDFYEMFFDDAIIGSKVLDLTLTGRDCGLKERAPMCGVPHHSAQGYIAKLVEAGYKVAVCEQTSEPVKGELVSRGVSHLATAGTLLNDDYLKADTNNYLMSVYFFDDAVGVSWADISTGEMRHEYIQAPVAVKLNELLSALTPAEIICNSQMLAQGLELSVIKYGGVCPFSHYNDSEYEYDAALEHVKSQLDEASVKQLKKNPHCLKSAGALLGYISFTQKRVLPHINSSGQNGIEKTLKLDASTRRTLELIDCSGKKKGSLLWLLDCTSTSMGARHLKKMIINPSADSSTINLRLDAVQALYNNIITLDGIECALKNIKDVERLCSKLSFGAFNPKECAALRDSLKCFSELKLQLKKSDAVLINTLDGQIGDFEQLRELLFNALADDPPQSVSDGKVIRAGYDQKIDRYRAVSQNAADTVAAMELAEKQATGIKNLKIGYNRVFGYYIEVLNSQQALVPFRYIRKQTVANAERFVTEELKKLEDDIIESGRNLLEYETAVYRQLIEQIKPHIPALLQAARAIAYIDCIVSFARHSKANNYVKPQIDDTIEHIKISEGRHPVAEKLLNGEEFVPNDTFLDGNQDRIMLITGPNMAGKSLYMRQVAMIAILAHIGCFVPARKAEICILDRVFTRVGASDDMLTGRSTFMVEMSEVSDIVAYATSKSLILLDEIGRGTATYDGLSIAWAVIEYISKIKAKVLFSTHYHELTELEGVVEGIKNYKLTVREFKNNIIFLRKLLRGSANKSFGIEVAALSGIPEEIITRAKELLKKLEQADIARQADNAPALQLSFFNTDTALPQIVAVLSELDIDNTSPRLALEILSDLKEKLEK